MTRQPVTPDGIALAAERKRNAALLGLLRRVQRALRLPGDSIDEAMRELSAWARGREDEALRGDGRMANAAGERIGGQEKNHE